jgi:hypothetical protein
MADIDFEVDDREIRSLETSQNNQSRRTGKFLF